MKFFWKIFFVFTTLITVVCSIFGIWAVSQMFQTSYAKEVEEGNRENLMFQYAFEMNLNSLPESYHRDDILVQLAQGIMNNLEQADYIYTIFDEQGHTVYTSKQPGTEQLENHLRGTLSEEQTCGYEVVTSEDSRVLYFMCRSQVGNQVFYLESAKDITEIYEERDAFYGRYRMIMLSLLVMTGVIIFVLSHLLTKSIVSLSESTRRFATGDYQIRAREGGEDEIGRLSRDFNQMADNLTEKMEELTDAVRRQEDFTASFAHELKTPLTSIIGYADMLRTMELSGEETNEAANYIYTQGKRLESLSFKLLELIVMGKQPLTFRQISVEDLADEVQNIVTSSLEQKQITLQLQVEPGEIQGERDLLISLLVNLIDNARKASEPGGHIRLWGKPEGEGYTLTVSDEGCGIAEEEIKKITEAFYMVDKSRSRKEGGAGLGMSLCSRIVSLHQATWQITSKAGEGTTVSIYFEKKEENKHETGKNRQSV